MSYPCHFRAGRVLGSEGVHGSINSDGNVTKIPPSVLVVGSLCFILASLGFCFCIYWTRRPLKSRSSSSAEKAILQEMIENGLIVTKWKGSYINTTVDNEKDMKNNNNSVAKENDEAKENFVFALSIMSYMKNFNLSRTSNEKPKDTSITEHVADTNTSADKNNNDENGNNNNTDKSNDNNDEDPEIPCHSIGNNLSLSGSSSSLDTQNRQSSNATSSAAAATTDKNNLTTGTNNTSNREDCAICLKRFKDGGVVVRSNNKQCCGHYFHKDCIVSWLLVGQNCCPLCREIYIVPSLEKNNKVEILNADIP